MYVPDDEIFWGTVGLALFFTYESMNFPVVSTGNVDYAPGKVYAHVRAMGFPFIAAGFWWVAAAFADAMNNCVTAFGSPPADCFTSPTWATPTSSIFPAVGTNLSLFFRGLFLLEILFGIAMTFYLAFRPIIRVLENREDLTS